MRDLFTEDLGGWLDDVPLLERLVAEKLTAMADEVRQAEGWKWAEGHLDYPSSHGFSRAYPSKVERGAEDLERIEAISIEYDALTQQWADVDELPRDVAARFDEIDAELEAFGDGYAYGADDLARGGVFVILTYDGGARVERGLIRPEDASTRAEEMGDENTVASDGEAGGDDERAPEAEDEPDGLTPLTALTSSTE